MPCPLWGDGSHWGDGDLWCRMFGSLPYYTEVDYRLNRCSTQVLYSGSGSFGIDYINPNIDYGTSDQDWTYWADVDRSSGQRVSIQLAYSSNGSFKCYYINPVVQVKKQLPVG